MGIELFNPTMHPLDLWTWRRAWQSKLVHVQGLIALLCIAAFRYNPNWSSVCYLLIFLGFVEMLIHVAVSEALANRRWSELDGNELRLEPISMTKAIFASWLSVRMWKGHFLTGHPLGTGFGVLVLTIFLLGITEVISQDIFEFSWLALMFVTFPIGLLASLNQSRRLIRANEDPVIQRRLERLNKLQHK